MKKQKSNNEANDRAHLALDVKKIRTSARAGAYYCMESVIPKTGPK
jgi:hypothetical protein